MGATLGINPLLYLPYAFLNLANPVVSLFYGYTGITMEKKVEKEELQKVPK
jgi:NhaC family Na+:H+ antiporter